MTLTKIEACTYSTALGYFVEKMEDGTWTAYHSTDPEDRFMTTTWSSPKHRTRNSALRALGMYRRLRKFNGHA